MSALYNMISALVAMLIAFALAHFGASERVKTAMPDAPLAASSPMTNGPVKSDDVHRPKQNSGSDTDQDQPSSQ